ncbi:MAG: DUF4364 family protein [Clostridiales bacterium]|nr:DUF4364 family protein [Clostridiales bacterium]
MSDLSSADAKVHILYIVGHVPGISYHMLMDKCLSSLYMDFFTFSKAYQELIAGNLMDMTRGENGMGEAIGGTEQLTLSAGGVAVLEDIVPSINLEVLSHLDSACRELNAKIADLARFTASSEPSGDGKVAVKLLSDDISLEITCSDPSLADIICDNWRQQGQKLSDTIIRTLTDTPEEI